MAGVLNLAVLLSMSLTLTPYTSYPSYLTYPRHPKFQELIVPSSLGVGLGFMSGMAVVAKTSDPTVIRLTKANNGVYAPEMRLAPCLFFAFFIPISFFWYGWSAEKKTHWIVPILGLLPFGFGTMGIFAAIQTYFIDAAGVYAASAMAGLTAIRCLFAAFLPLAGPKMYASLGLG